MPETQDTKFEKLLELHFDSVYRYAYRLAGNATAAEDISQEVFLRAMRAVDQLRNDQAALGWLLTIARHEFYRWAKSNRSFSDLSSPEPSVPATAIDRLDCEDWVQHALGQLPSEFRIPLLMYYFEQLSYAEMAESLGIPIGTVMSRLNRGKTRLRQLLDDRSAMQVPSVDRDGRTVWEAVE